MQNRTKALIDSLVEAEVPARFENPYKQPSAAHNLLAFLEKHDPASTTVLLIGEAPGHRGAAISGVPLTSSAILCEDWGDPWNAFGSKSGFLDSWGRYRREPTATIVWHVLSQLFGSRPLPLTWNAVPFHPHSEDGGDRALPTSSLHLGEPWLERIMDLFPSARPIAVGKRADDALRRLGSSGHAVIPHPSYGGKAGFVSGLSSEGLHLKES